MKNNVFQKITYSRRKIEKWRELHLYTEAEQRFANTRENTIKSSPKSAKKR